MKEFFHTFHRDLAPTKIWGFNGQFPGPVINVNQGECAHVKWMIQLPEKHLLSIDRTLHGSGEHMPEVRTVVHLHGAEVETESDGYPEAWFTNNYKYVGPVFDSPVYKYNNKQRAGLVGMYIIRDEEERMLNASNERFYRMSLSTNQKFIQIGSDGGLLEKSVYMNELTIGPSERMDVVIDFSKHEPGTEIVLNNTANSPFDFLAPIGVPPDPNKDGLVMQFKVIKLTRTDTSKVPCILSKIPKLNEWDANRTRDITLDARFDMFGRFNFLLSNKGFMERIDVKPKLNDTEIWRFINTGGATHPMHIHLIQFHLIRKVSPQIAY